MENKNNNQQSLKFENIAGGGPIFESEPGWGGQISSWIKSNSKKFILFVFIASSAFALFFLKTPFWANKENPPSGRIEKNSDDNKSVKPEGGETRVAKTQQNISKIFKQTARKGQGITHLARASLAEYLSEKPDGDLLPEHKIYIEDYLRKLKNKKTMFIGESVEFSEEDITRAAQRAKKLKPEELENLSKYVKRVSELI